METSSWNLLLQHSTTASGLTRWSVTTMFIQSIILGTAIPPWNRGRPVQEVLARRVPPCPYIRGIRAVPACSYYPPIQYCSDVDIMLAGISDGLMTLATEAMLSLNAIMLKIRTLEATYIANKFMDMQRSEGTNSNHYPSFIIHTIFCTDLIPNIFSILKLFDTELQVISRQHVLTKKIF